MENPETINPNKDVHLSEEKDALRASFPQLLLQADKVRFALYQINAKQCVLDSVESKHISSAFSELTDVCKHLALLTSTVYDYE